MTAVETGDAAGEQAAAAGAWAPRMVGGALLYVLLGGPLGLLWLAVLGAGFLAGGATAVLGIGLLVLLGTLVLARALGELERRLANALLDGGIPAPPAQHRPTRPAAWAGQVVGDPRTWRSVGWLLFRALAGLLVLAGAGAAAVVLAALLVLPFRDGYLQFGSSWRSAAGWSSAWAPPVGIAGLAASVALARVLAGVHRRVAQVLLGPDPAAEVAALQGRVAGAAERARLARDLHDSVGHAVTLAVIQADAAVAALRADPAYAARALAEIGAAGRRALEELDTALGVLREDPPARRPDPTLADLPDLVRRARDAGLPITLTVTGVDRWTGAAARPAAAAAYRVVQEALTNVLRHAGPAPTTVTVDGTTGLDLEIRNLATSTRSGPAPVDPRPGGDVPAAAGPGAGRSGRGLTGLAERVRLLGGHLAAGPDAAGPDAPGPDAAGWTVRATLPFPGGPA